MNITYCDQVSLASMDSQPYTNVSNNCSVKYWRNIVLEQMYQSLSVSKGGLQECIVAALGFRPEKVFLSFIWVFSINFLCLIGKYLSWNVNTTLQFPKS